MFRGLLVNYSLPFLKQVYSSSILKSASSGWNVTRSYAACAFPSSRLSSFMRSSFVCRGKVSQSILMAAKSVINVQPVRTIVRNHYRPNAARRIKKHGIHIRIQTESGLAILWRRFLKGRHNLAVYEDFRPLLKQYQKPPRKVRW